MLEFVQAKRVDRSRNRHVSLVSFAGLRVREQELLALGIGLPGLGKRRAAGAEPIVSPMRCGHMEYQPRLVVFTRRRVHSKPQSVPMLLWWVMGNRFGADRQVYPRFTIRSIPRFLEVVTTRALLVLAGIQMGDTLRGARMSEALLVEAADGYKVVYALAELDPAFATREIVLADKRDGKQLDSKQGPFRVVAPGDNRPARWIRQGDALESSRGIMLDGVDCDTRQA